MRDAWGIRNGRNVLSVQEQTLNEGFDSVITVTGLGFLRPSSERGDL